MIKEIKTIDIKNNISLYQDEYNEKHFFYETSIHKIHYEVSGNENGIPVVFVHGGPGGSMGDLAKRFFNKDKYYIISIDQRGAGRSLPFASLEENTTFDLINDMEAIRKELKIEKWVVFGGSWGSTLSLIYAINHPDRVISLILRGIFLARKEDVDFLFKEGSSYFYPEYFEKFLSPLTEKEKENPLHSYYNHLLKDIEIAKKYAKFWSDWEMSLVYLYRKDTSEDISDKDISLARLEAHYFVNNSFLPLDNYILENTEKIKNIKTYIVHGRYDVDCRLKGAYELYNKLDNATLYIIQDAGHSSLEKGITHTLMTIMEEL